CDVWQLRDRVFDTLSGGEQKRVALARALAQDTPILLLDEPAAFLDPRHQVELHDLLADLVADRGIAALAVMHDLNLAAQYCHRVALLAEGSVRALGPIDEVMTYARIRETFGCDVYVGLNELRNTRYFVPMGKPRVRPIGVTISGSAAASEGELPEEPPKT
ncbi:MAG: ABC transporter ATP-binding protein, partial [Deltaproteobacteria bacterium]|nr:ABC transporter ATP-binding protein [Deltaproteobacteria bacterium]